MSATIGTTLDYANSYSHDQFQRHTALVQQGQSGGDAVTAKRITFGYNLLSQRNSIDRFQSTGTSTPVAETDFTFDGANRLRPTPMVATGPLATKIERQNHRT